MNITLTSLKHVNSAQILTTLSVGLALQKAKTANNFVHPCKNYLECHITTPIKQRRAAAETATNAYERLVLKLN